ncbi:hypothetical protein DL98DRAFT_452409 [Cadophora sp. DSE1049]|nr:hypothetical protein DL98DRAFT_452409 [Cadophora sp. DSE1049]
MFYSHEILTSRKYGVATIWLVATLGAKSNTKKVTKKAILDVNVKKACETIIEPEAPMALRLQSNLLYGVSKVYNQQWEYLLLDTQTAQNTMRTLIKVARNTELDATAVKSQYVAHLYERNARRAASINPQRRLGSDSAASGRVRKEHEDAFVGRIQGVHGDGDFDMPLYDDDMPIRNAVLSQWIKEYPENMTASCRIKVKHHAATQAKKNAFYYVYGAGINGAGDSIRAGKFTNPLAIFSGNELMAKITSNPIPEPKSKKRTKRGLAADEEDEEETPSKRAREDEVGRGNHKDDMMFNLEDDQYPHSHEKSVEVGRDAASALADHPPSVMPWNISSSLHSHQRGHSSSIQGRVGILGSQVGSMTGRRLTSPLVGRGSAIPGELEQFSQLMDDDMVMYGRDDDGLGSASQASGFHPGGIRTSSQTGGGDDFEIFGVAAGVDTQTAGSSQWMKDVMDRESNNFFEYVKNTIEEKSTDELGDEDDAEPQPKTVTFEELFVPEKNSCIVAAQAFYHILSLATKRKVWVEQDVDDDLLVPFGEIKVGVV